VILGPRGALVLVCATLSVLIRNQGSAAAAPRHEMAFAGSGLSRQVLVLRETARACRSATRMKERVNPNVFFDSHAHPSSEPRIGSCRFIQDSKDHNGLGFEKTVKHPVVVQSMAAKPLEAQSISAQPIAAEPLVAQPIAAQPMAAVSQQESPATPAKPALTLEAPEEHPTLLGSRRIHSISEVVYDPELAEDLAPGAGVFLGSRRLGALNQLLMEGVSGAAGAVQGAAGAAGEGLYSGMDAVSDAVSGGASMVTGSVSGAFGMVASGLQGGVASMTQDIEDEEVRLAGAARREDEEAALLAAPDAQHEATPLPAAPAAVTDVAPSTPPSDHAAPAAELGTVPPLKEASPPPHEPEAAVSGGEEAAVALATEDAPSPPVRKPAAVVSVPTIKGAHSDVVEMSAGADRVFKVASDVVHYPDWAGDGIASVTVRKQEPGYIEAVYKAGAFGYMFDFVLAFKTSSREVVSSREKLLSSREPQRITFQVLESSVVKRLEGGYWFEPIDASSSKVSFEVIAELGNFVPKFIENAISKLVVEIALGELRKYVESPRCEENLVAQGKL